MKKKILLVSGIVIVLCLALLVGMKFMKPSRVEPAAPSAEQPREIAVAAVDYPGSAKPGDTISITMLIANNEAVERTVIPVAVLIDSKANELAEADGGAAAIAPGVTDHAAKLEMLVKELPAGQYYFAFILLDRATMTKTGGGKYRQSFEILSKSGAR